MMVITHDLEVCACCFVKVATDDESSCRDYYGHTHPGPTVPPDTVPGGAFREVWGGEPKCDACGTLQGYGATMHTMHVLARA